MSDREERGQEEERGEGRQIRCEEAMGKEGRGR